MCAEGALSRCCTLIAAGGLLLLSWQQWQLNSTAHQAQRVAALRTVAFRSPTLDDLLSQARVAEASASAILWHAGTELSLGQLMQSAAHLQRAQALYRQAVLSRPLCADCQHRLAQVAALLALLSPSQGGSIRAGLQRSLALTPSRADLWEETGRFLLSVWPAVSEEDRRFALACLDRALTLAPQRMGAVLAATFVVDLDLPGIVSGTDPHRGFAATRLYQQYGDTERARRQAQKVVAQLRPEIFQAGNDVSSLLLLGEVQLFLGNHEEAREAYTRGCSQTDDLVLQKEFCWRLAAWHFERQDYVTAREYYHHYLILAPDSPAAVLRFGLSTLRAGNHTEGLQWLERAVGMRPGDAGWQVQLAGAFEEAGRYDRANALYRRLLARETPPRPDLLQRLARNYKHLGLGREALAAYRQLLRLDANNVEARAFIELVEGQAKKD